MLKDSRELRHLNFSGSSVFDAARSLLFPGTPVQLRDHILEAILLPRELESAWKEASQSYAHAVQLNTNDVDAVYNLSFVQQQLGFIVELREAMRRAKLQADEAVRRNEYHHALEILQSLNNPIANKKFQDYVKKLKDIDAIVTPSQP